MERMKGGTEGSEPTGSGMLQSLYIEAWNLICKPRRGDVLYFGDEMTSLATLALKQVQLCLPQSHWRSEYLLLWCIR